MLDIVSEVFQNYRIYTSISLGWDPEVTPILNDRANYLQFVDTEFPDFSFSEEYSDIDIYYPNFEEIIDPEEVKITDLTARYDYLDRYFDFVFMSLDVSFNLQKDLFDFFVRSRCKFILMGPNSKKMIPNSIYNREDIYHKGSQYILYYLDIVRSHNSTTHKVNYIDLN